MNPTTKLPILALLGLFSLAPAKAQVPSILNYQGRVTVGGTNLTTNAAQFKFALVDSNGTTVYWKNDGTTTTNEPSSAVTVPVAQGLYSSLLGDTTLSNMAAIPSSAFTNQNVNLRVWFSRGGTNPFVQLSPDQRIGAAGYALRAAAADSANVTNVSGDLAVSGTLSVGQLVGGLYSVALPNSGATIGGGYGNTASAFFAMIGGGRYNTASDYFATIGGGQSNTASGYTGTVGGGQENTASGYFSIVGGGLQNTASGSFLGRATVGGGWTNTASGDFATIGGGRENTASGDTGTVGGGRENTASGYYSTVGGGRENTASGYTGTVGGGQGNTATNYAFAAGTRAKATNDGAFVWADATESDFESTANNQFLIRAGGGVGINTNNPGSNALSVAGSASISENLNVASINGRTNFSSYATTFGFVQNNATAGLTVPTGEVVIATFVQQPGVAITSCSVIFYQNTSGVTGTIIFRDATGTTGGIPSTLNLTSPQIFNGGSFSSAWRSFEVAGLNISSAPSPRIIQVVMSADLSNKLNVSSITVGFTPD